MRALVIALTTAALLGAPAARADAGDDAFIGALTGSGLTVTSAHDAITAAHGLCDKLRSGLMAGVEYLRAGTDYTDDEINTFGALAIETYCPAMGSAVLGMPPEQP